MISGTVFIPKANNFLGASLACGPPDILIAAVVVGQSKRESWVFSLPSSPVPADYAETLRNKGAATNKLQGKRKMEEEHKDLRLTDVWTLFGTWCKRTGKKFL